MSSIQKLHPVLAVLPVLAFSTACGIIFDASTLMDDWAVSRSGVVEDLDSGLFDPSNLDLNAPSYKSMKAENWHAGRSSYTWRDMNRTHALECGDVTFMGIPGNPLGAGPHFSSQGCPDPKRRSLQMSMQHKILTNADVADYLDNTAHPNPLRFRADLAISMVPAWAYNAHSTLGLPREERWMVKALVTVNYCDRAVQQEVVLALDSQSWVPVHVPVEIDDFKGLIAPRPGQNCPQVDVLDIRVMAYGAEMHFHNVKWTVFEKF